MGGQKIKHENVLEAEEIPLKEAKVKCGPQKAQTLIKQNPLIVLIILLLNVLLMVDTQTLHLVVFILILICCIFLF